MLDHFGIHEIARQIATKEKSVEEISRHLPCHIHTNRIDDFSIIEADSKIQNYLGMTIEEINEQGFDLIQKIVNKKDLANAVNVNMNYIQQNGKQTHVSFFQRINYPFTDREHIYYTRGKIIGDCILNISTPVHHIETFNKKITDICENSDVIKRKTQLFNKLTKREINVAKYLLKGDRIPEIANSLVCSAHTVKNHKTNIYRKIEVSNYFEFYSFIKDFQISMI